MLSFGIPPDQIRQSRESSNLLEPRNAAKLHHAACQLPTGLPALSAPLEHHMQQSSRQSSENPSDAEENEERQDDRANDPACIQCDDGGEFQLTDICMHKFHCLCSTTNAPPPPPPPFASSTFPLRPRILFLCHNPAPALPLQPLTPAPTS